MVSKSEDISISEDALKKETLVELEEILSQTRNRRGKKDYENIIRYYAARLRTLEKIDKELELAGGIQRMCTYSNYDVYPPSNVYQDIYPTTKYGDHSEVITLIRDIKNNMPAQIKKKIDDFLNKICNEFWLRDPILNNDNYGANISDQMTYVKSLVEDFRNISADNHLNMDAANTLNNSYNKFLKKCDIIKSNALNGRQEGFFESKLQFFNNLLFECKYNLGYGGRKKKTKKTTNKPIPSNLKLYKKIKEKVYKKIPKHSAYRSGIVVQQYKNKFREKYGNKEPYKGKKTVKRGLKRWFKEKWVNQRGEIGYKYKNDVYRPSKRITKKTPTTHNELSKRQIKRARKEKYRTGRVKRFKKKGGNKTKKNMNKPKKVDGNYTFKDFPNFKPNLSPRDIFKMGSFGGTYWRPIKSKFFNIKLKNKHKKYPKSWWKGIPETHFIKPFNDYDNSINKYGVKVGTTLDFWESKEWINKLHPYGWVHWYCDFFMGKRCEDDERQVKRWEGVSGKRGRFMRFLVTQILKNKTKWNDETISPKIRQTLQHWAYKLTKKDFDNEVKRRKKK